MASLAHKTTAGILWNFTEQLGRRGLGMIVTLLLARVLSPKDYGLVAMMSVFLAVASSLMDSGFKHALIRTQGVTQTDFNTAFYANLTLGVVAYTLLFIAAPYIAVFYEEPRLIALIRVVAIGVLVNSFQIVQLAILSRELNFKLQLKASLPAGLISGVAAVSMAYAGFGVWALVAQMLIASLVTTIVLWLNQSWRPSLSFSRDSLRRMYGFGCKLFFSGLLDKIFTNLYVIVIAKLFTASVAGLYFFAEKVKDVIVGQMVDSIQSVTYPALASIQNDDVRLKAGYRRVILVSIFILFPAMIFMAALAEPIFLVLLPSRWAPAVVYLQLMCLGALLYPLHSINLNILKVKGRSDIVLYLEVFKKSLAAAILFVSFRYGVIGILVGQVLGSVLAYLPNSFFSARLIGYPISEQVADFLPALVLSSLVGAGLWGLVIWVEWPALVELVVLGVVAGVCYLVGAHVMKLESYLMLREMLASKINRKTS